MRRFALSIACMLCAALAAEAALVRERWSGKDTRAPHNDALKVEKKGNRLFLVFDLKALSGDAKVRHASLFSTAGRAVQPKSKIVIKPAGANGEPTGEALPLEAPLYGSFDATAAVQGWQEKPDSNGGFLVEAFDGLDPKRAYLEILYETAQTPQDLPAQTAGLRAVHRHGQTFLLFHEAAEFQPPKEAVAWIDTYSGLKTKTAAGPGKGFGEHPCVPAITLKALRDLQGMLLRDTPNPKGQSLAPAKRLREIPEIEYRIYRHDKPITRENLHEAAPIGSAAPLCAYQEQMVILHSEGEYYKTWEDGKSLLACWCYADGQGVPPGDAFYVHTPAADGQAWYAVTVMKDGRENLAQIGAANSLTQAVEEKAAPIRPVFQFAFPSKLRYGNGSTVEERYAIWLAPPYANVPDNQPRRVHVAIPDEFQAPGPLDIGTRADNRFFGVRAEQKTTIAIVIEQDISYGGDLCYHEGRNTLRAFEQGHVDYFSERYLKRVMDWALEKWPIDRSRIEGGFSTHFNVRHPELFAKVYSGPYGHDFDGKWNPMSNSLAGRLGPAGLCKTVDGHPAWEMFDVGWYLRTFPARDIPIMYCESTTPKDSGHGTEFGWQDDPRGLAALRDARQPYIATWGGRHIAKEVQQLYARLPAGRSIPAFSRGSLDANPGNGDQEDGDPWGAINAYLVWNETDGVDEAARWELTVQLAPSAPRQVCTVDLTPRHCAAFKAKPGQLFRWRLTEIEGDKEISAGEVKADAWGLVTLEQIEVAKTPRRVRIEGTEPRR